jgi:hypothetical protein
VIGFPGKSVAGIHQFGRVIFYEQHLQRLATRQAIDEGLQGNALSARVARLTSNPSVDMMREAADAAIVICFSGMVTLVLFDKGD